jgi:hypothetical protein
MGTHKPGKRVLGYQFICGVSDRLFNVVMKIETPLWLDDRDNKIQDIINDLPIKLLEKCESPIEFMYFIFSMSRIPNLIPQVEIGKYRVDFASISNKIFVELDGHDTHKSKEHRTYDAQRDRNLRLDGWQVIRFTGTEVYADVLGCVRKTCDLFDVIDKYWMMENIVNTQKSIQVRVYSDYLQPGEDKDICDWDKYFDE